MRINSAGGLSSECLRVTRAESMLGCGLRLRAAVRGLLEDACGLAAGAVAVGQSAGAIGMMLHQAMGLWLMSFGIGWADAGSCALCATSLLAVCVLRLALVIR